MTVVSPIVAEYLGIRSHGVIFGIVFFCGTIGGAIGPVFAGYVFDITGSYDLVLWTSTAVSAIGLGLTLSLKPGLLEAENKLSQ